MIQKVVVVVPSAPQQAERNNTFHGEDWKRKQLLNNAPKGSQRERCRSLYRKCENNMHCLKRAH